MTIHTNMKQPSADLDCGRLRERRPVEFDFLYTAMEKCARRLVDTELPCTDVDACYAVLSVECTVKAYTFFLIAVCPYYRIRAARVCEERDHIELTLDLVAREGVVPFDPFEKNRTARDLFFRYATQTDLTFALLPAAEGWTARFSFVRFRTDRFTAAGVSDDQIGDLIFGTMQEYAEKKTK